MKKTKTLAFCAAIAAAVSGCTVIPNACCQSGAGVVGGVYQPTKFMAVGYGAVGGNSSQYTFGQQKLMAMRAARVDAYRALAEQVYGFRVWGNTAVSAFATQNDSVRTYVDAVIRGARLVNMTAVADGNFEATVELELNPAFSSCVSNVAVTSHCALPRTTESYCGVSGCVQPSAYYYSGQ